MNMDAFLALPGVLSVVPVSVPSAIQVKSKGLAAAAAAVPAATSEGERGGLSAVAVAVATVVSCAALAAAAASVLWIRHSRATGAQKAVGPLSPTRTSGADKDLEGDGFRRRGSSTANKEPGDSGRLCRRTSSTAAV